MADMTSSFNPQPYDPFQTMGNILGIQQKRQALLQAQQDYQTGQYQQQTAQATANQASQRDTELAAAGKFVMGAVNDPSYADSDGNPNTAKFQKGLLNVAPVYGGDVLAHMTSGFQEAVKTKGELLKLSQNERSDIGERMSALAANPKTSKTDLLDMVADLRDEHTGDRGYGRLLDHFVSNIPQGPMAGQPIQDYLQKSVSSLRGTTGQTPTTMDTGTQVQPGATNQFTGGFTPTGAPLDKTQIQQLPNNQLGVVGPHGASTIPYTGPQVGPGAGGPPSGGLQATPRPSPMAPQGDQQRYTAQMEENRKHVNDVSAAANDVQNGVGPTRYRNDQIQDILNSKTFSPTGPGSEQMNWIASKLPGESGDAFQKIGHYLAQNSAAIATKMGVPGTNMGAEQAAAASGNTSQNRGALQEVTKVNDAMNTALEMYNRGLSKVSGNGSDPSKVAAYRQAFGQSFDMNALRYDDALRRGDKDEVSRVIESLPGQPGSKQRAQAMQAMAQHRKVMHSLAENGDLPQ